MSHYFYNSSRGVRVMHVFSMAYVPVFYDLDKAEIRITRIYSCVNVIKLPVLAWTIKFDNAF